MASTFYRPPLVFQCWSPDTGQVSVNAQVEVLQNLLLRGLRSQDKFLRAAGFGPQNYDWPVPKGAAPIQPWVTSQTDVFQNLLLRELRSKDTFFGAAGQVPDNLEWAVPARQPAFTQDAVQGRNLALTFVAAPAASPFGQHEWPNPAPGPQPLTLDHVEGNNLALAPPPFAPFYFRDWTTPPGAQPITYEFTWPGLLATTLRSKDKFFGAAGQPPANMDWPNRYSVAQPVIDDMAGQNLALNFVAPPPTTTTGFEGLRRNVGRMMR